MDAGVGRSLSFGVNSSLASATFAPSAGVAAGVATGVSGAGATVGATVAAGVRSTSAGSLFFIIDTDNS